MINAFVPRGFADRVAVEPLHGGWAVRVPATVFMWHERARQRRRLCALDDRMLKDIGLSRADLEREAGKYFWMK